MIKPSLLALALCAASLPAAAGLSLQRTTTITDDFGGQAIIEASAQLSESNGTRVAEASFSNFHPGNEHSAVNGDISREVLRDGELVTVSYDGMLTLTGNSNPQSLSISFEDLRIERGEESVDLGGSLVVNGQTIDAANAPQQVRAAVLRLLRFFRA